MDYSVEVADAATWLIKREEKAHCAVFDPPFPGMERHIKRGTTTRLVHKGWFRSVSYEYLVSLYDYLWAAMEWNTHAYMFADQDLMLHTVPAVAEGVYGERRNKGGWTFWKGLVWYKTGKLGGGYHGRAVHEMILFWEKGKRRLRDLGMPDVLSCPRVKKAMISTQKPVSLIERLIRASTQPGELIIDPFCGSGSTGVAALRTGRRFAGCDIDPEMVKIANERLADEASKLTAGKACVTM